VVYTCRTHLERSWFARPPINKIQQPVVLLMSSCQLKQEVRPHFAPCNVALTSLVTTMGAVDFSVAKLAKLLIADMRAGSALRLRSASCIEVHLAAPWTKYHLLKMDYRTWKPYAGRGRRNHRQEQV